MNEVQLISGTSGWMEGRLDGQSLKKLYWERNTDSSCLKARLIPVPVSAPSWRDRWGLKLKPILLKIFPFFWAAGNLTLEINPGEGLPRTPQTQKAVWQCRCWRKGNLTLMTWNAGIKLYLESDLSLRKLHIAPDLLPSESRLSAQTPSIHHCLPERFPVRWLRLTPSTLPSLSEDDVTCNFPYFKS